MSAYKTSRKRTWRTGVGLDRRALTDHVRLGDVGMRRQHPLDRSGVMEGSR
jgi:hypothetical protein